MSPGSGPEPPSNDDGRTGARASPSTPLLLRRLVRETLRRPDATGPSNLRRLAALTLFLPVFAALQGVHWLGFLLDDLLFPGYRDIEVREPLFVVGLPRSGTSFVQRVLAGDRRFTTLRLWELLLAPSITERKVWHILIAADRAVGRPLGRLVGAVETVAFRWMDEVHPVSLDAPEEDYLLLLPAFACFLLVVPFPYHRAVWRLSRFDELPAGEREPILAFYRSCIQRHLYVVGSGKRLLSKNPSFTPMVRSLAKRFPDARFACCVRDPREAVPSLLSSLEGGARIFGYHPSDTGVRDPLVEMLEFYARHVLTVLPTLPEDRRAFLPLTGVRDELRERVVGMYERFGWDVDPRFDEHLRTMARRARDHRSGHDYALEEFDLTPEEIDGRFPELDRRFGYPADP